MTFTRLPAPESCHSVLLNFCEVQNIARECESISWCDLFVYFPLGKSLNGGKDLASSAFLKSIHGSHQPPMPRRVLCSSRHLEGLTCHLLVCTGLEGLHCLCRP